MNRWLALVIAATALLITLYFINPFGTATTDPRARLFGVTTYRVASSSMAPTLLRGELVLVSSSAYMSRRPALGDIIVFRYPQDRNVVYLQRVAARAGDRLAIRSGVVYVNDQPRDEPYLDAPALKFEYSRTLDEFTVPDGHLFVLGDNRDNARDGRFWGFVPDDDVVGKVTHIWLSENPERIGSVR
ncbi:MAG TPA: signal peptidase I [Gammaproteobacteria bacterium]